MIKIIVLSFILCLYGSEVFSQQKLAIENLGSKAKKEWQVNFALKPNLARYYDCALVGKSSCDRSKQGALKFILI